MRVYLDNAASTPMDTEVLDHMLPYLLEHQGNPSSVHFHGRNLRAAIEKARKTIAELLGAAPGEIFFTSGGTEADNTAIYGAVEGLGLKHIVSTRIEHHAVSYPIEKLEASGTVKVTWLDVDRFGLPDLSQLDNVLAENPGSFVSLMHGNNELGSILDIEKAGEICHLHGAIFHSDTVQTMGTLPYNLSDMPVDMVTASAHKFYGPKGVGFLYIRSGLKIPPLLLGGSQERNMRAGTESLPSIIGMAFALEKCVKNLSRKNDHLWNLKSRMLEGLKERFPGIQVNGFEEREKAIPTVLNVAFPLKGTENMLLFNLDIQGISASGGSACSSGSVNASHVLLGTGCDHDRAANSVRFSFGIQNTEEEIDFALSKLEEILRVKA